MEPTSLTSRSDAEGDPLEALLRRPLPPVVDEGFSQRVMAALPPAQRAAPRRIVVAVGALAGLAVAFAHMESFTTVQRDWTATKLALAQVAAGLSDPNMLIALSVAGVSMLYAFLSAESRIR